MSTQELRGKEFFSWLQKRIPRSQYFAIEKNKNVINRLLMQKHVFQKPLFSMEGADEVSAKISKVPSCFVNAKLKSAAVQMVTMYSTYLEEKASHESEKELCVASDLVAEAEIEAVFRDELYLPLKDALIRHNIKTRSAICQMDLWEFMNRNNLYSIGVRQTIYNQIQRLLNCERKENHEKRITLRVNKDEYVGATASEAFLAFCEKMVTVSPLKFRTLIGLRMTGHDVIPIQKNSPPNSMKITRLNAYIGGDLECDQIVDYARWICGKCDYEYDNITIKSGAGEAVETRNAKELHDGMRNSASDGGSAVEGKDDALISQMERIVLKADLDGITYDDLRDALGIPMNQVRANVSASTHVIDVKGKLIHEEAFIDWEDGANQLETIIEKLMQKNNGYVSIGQLFEYVRAGMNMFLNDNDIGDERSVYDIARHLFEKTRYHGKHYSFVGNMHISHAEEKIGTILDIIKKYAAEQGGVFRYTGLAEHLESVGVGTGNLRNQMRITTEPVFFYYDKDVLISSESMSIDEAWEESVSAALKDLFADVGDHIVLRQIPEIWYDRLPALPGTRTWTPLLLQSVLRFYGGEFNARTIQALDGQAIDTLHTMLVENDSAIQNFGDVVIAYLLESEMTQREFRAEELRCILVEAEILHGNELIWNMPKALKNDGRFAWDANGENVTVLI